MAIKVGLRGRRARRPHHPAHRLRRPGHRGDRESRRDVRDHGGRSAALPRREPRPVAGVPARRCRVAARRRPAASHPPTPSRRPASARALFEVYRDTVAELRGDDILEGETPTDPVDLSYTLAAALVLNLAERQAMLEAPDVVEPASARHPVDARPNCGPCRPSRPCRRPRWPARSGHPTDHAGGRARACRTLDRGAAQSLTDIRNV